MCIRDRVKAQEVERDLAIYNQYITAMLENYSEEDINGLRSVLLVSSDPVVDDVALRGSAHVDHLAAANNLQVIREEVL